MAGANGVAKFLRVDRDEAIVDIKTRGAQFTNPQFVLFPPTGSATPTVISANNMLQNLQFNNLTANALTGPAVVDMYNALVATFPKNIYDQWTVQLQNLDPVNTKTITLTGFYIGTTTPAVIQIPPGSTATVTYDLRTQQPPTFNVLSVLSGTTVPPLPGTYIPMPTPAAAARDILVWDGVTSKWEATNAGPNGNTGINIPTASVVNNFLVYNGTAWVSSSAFPAAITSTLNPLYIARPAPANADDMLLYNGTDWVSSTVYANAQVQLLATDNIVSRPRVGPHVNLIQVDPGFIITNTGGLVIASSNPQVLLNDGIRIPNVAANAAAAQMELRYGNTMNGTPGNDIGTNSAQLLLNWPLSQAPLAGEANTLAFIQCQNPNTAIGAPYSNGIVFRVGNAGTVRGLAFTIWSDAKAKKNIRAINDISFDDIDIVQPVSYHYKSQKDDEKQRVGIIAQDVERVLPAIVSDEGEYKTLDTIGISAMNLAFIHALKKEIVDLKTRLGKLEAAAHVSN